MGVDINPQDYPALLAGLPGRRQRFVQEYLVDFNARQAATRAEYSAKTAHVRGCKLMKDPAIAAAIAAGRVEIAAKAGVTAEAIARELAKIGFANMEDYTKKTKGGGLKLDATNLTRDQMAAIGEVSYDAAGLPKIKLMDKRAALVDLGKHIGMFIDRSKVEHGGEVKFIVSRADEECA